MSYGLHLSKTRDSALFLEHEICSRPTDRREVISREPANFFEHESHSYECMSLETPPVFEISRMTIIDPPTKGT